MMKHYRRYGRRGLGLWVLEQFYHLIEGDHLWAERRASVIVFGVVILSLMGRAVEHIEQWWTLTPYLEALPGPIVFALSLLHPQTLRHLLPPLAGALLAILIASNYVRDLFNLPDLETGYWYLTAAMFGWDYPYLKLKSTGYEPDDSEMLWTPRQVKMEAHPIPKIGGPGVVNVVMGNVALYEHVGGPSKVAGAGRHFIRRFETLREVIDLRDQIRTRPEVKALTKDGILVTIQNVQVSFRVRTSNRPRTQKDVYPFSVSAVKRIAYGKTVNAKGPVPWTDSVTNAVVTAIRGYVSRTLLDDLVSRREGDAKDPRDKIKAMFEHKDTRKRFNDMGVDLLWVSLGHIKTPQDILDERVATWSAEWERQAQATLSEAEAHKLRLTEYAKAMARLELVESSLKDMPLTVEDAPTAERIIIHLVEALTSTGRKVGATMSMREMMEYLTVARLLDQQDIFAPPDKLANRKVIADPQTNPPAQALPSSTKTDS